MEYIYSSLPESSGFLCSFSFAIQQCDLQCSYKVCARSLAAWLLGGAGIVTYTAPVWNWGWINAVLMVLGQQSLGFSGDHSPVSTSMSSTAAMSSSGLLFSPLAKIRAASSHKTHPALPQHTARGREAYPRWSWKPFYLKTLGRFSHISEKYVQVLIVCVGQLFLLLPSFQCCFSL